MMGPQAHLLPGGLRRAGPFVGHGKKIDIIVGKAMWQNRRLFGTSGLGADQIPAVAKCVAKHGDGAVRFMARLFFKLHA